MTKITAFRSLLALTCGALLGGLFVSRWKTQAPATAQTAASALAFRAF